MKAVELRNFIKKVYEKLGQMVLANEITAEEKRDLGREIVRSRLNKEDLELN